MYSAADEPDHIGIVDAGPPVEHQWKSHMLFHLLQNIKTQLGWSTIKPVYRPNFCRRATADPVLVYSPVQALAGIAKNSESEVEPLLVRQDRQGLYPTVELECFDFELMGPSIYAGIRLIQSIYSI